MPYGQPAQLANLKPAWTPGNAPRGPNARHSGNLDKALAMCRKVAPELVDILVSFVRDTTLSVRDRIKAAEIILGIAIPKNAAEVFLNIAGNVELRPLEVRIVEADGSEHSLDEWQAKATPSEQSPQLSPPSAAQDVGDRGAKPMVAGGDYRSRPSPISASPPPRQVVLVAPDKVPSLRARAAAGIFR